MPLESAIVSSILDLFKRTPRACAEKVQGTSAAAGRADINASYKGRMIRLEVKTPDHKNKASVRQLINLRKWRQAGAVTGVVYSVRSVEHLFVILDANQVGEFKFYEDNGCESHIFVPDPEAVYQGPSGYTDMEKGYMDEL